MMDLIQRIKEYLHVDDTDDASDYDDVDNTEDYYDDDDTEIKNTSKVVEDEVEEEEPARPKVATRNTKVGKVIPTSVEESRIVVDNLKGGRAVVLNLEDVRTNIAQRIVDFICGAAYDMEGNLQSISDSIFIVTPPNIGLTGDFTDLLGSSGLSQDSADASGFGSRL